MRILSLHPATTELLCAIGAGGMIVGRTDECDYPASVQKIPSIGSNTEVSSVLVDVFEPELVLTAYGQKELAAELGEEYRVIYFDPQSFDDLYRGIVALADLVGKQVEADLVVHDIRTLVERLRERALKYHSVRVYCEVSHTPPVAAKGYIAELIELAGAEVFEGKVTPERIESFDPQMIISCVADEDKFNFELLTARDGWSCNAIQYERLFSIPAHMLYRPGPRLRDGIRKIARLVHGIEL